MKKVTFCTLALALAVSITFTALSLTGCDNGGGGDDSTPPTVLSVTPRGADDPISGNVVITFSEAMDASPGTVKLNNLTALSGGSWNAAKTVFTIAYSGLSGGTIYSVNISGFKDAAGNTMEADSSNIFMTTGPAPSITLPTQAGLYYEDSMSGTPLVTFNKSSATTATNTFNAAITYVNEHPGLRTYILLLDDDVSVGPLSAFNATLTLRIIGLDSNRTITLSSNGSLFTVGVNAMLSLEENITLKGLATNNRPLVKVNQYGNLYMSNGSVITGNTNTTSGSDSSLIGGGVNVYGGNLTMIGGKITGNKAYRGGGVYAGGGRFYMTGGEISGNTATTTGLGGEGGGVLLANNAPNTGCTFTMSGGTITSNTAVYGGGVTLIGNGAFIMNSPAKKANIYGNTATSTDPLYLPYPQVVRMSVSASISGSDTGGEGW